MTEKIIAYRVGDYFLCPDHYQMSVRILSVHNIELPAQAIKEGEIQDFVCNQCEDTGKSMSGNEGEKVVYLQERINRVGLLDKVNDILECLTKSEKSTKAEIDMAGEISKINRRAKFIQKTLHLAWEGRRLSRKNITTLQNFFDNLRENLDTLKAMIALNVFTSIEHRQLLAERGRRNFCALSSKEQEILRTRFGAKDKCSQESEEIAREIIRC
jgi:hypothetical protein